jgi:acyl carrier protein
MEDSAAQPNSNDEQTSPAREVLEQEKLQVEITQLKRRFFERPTFWLALATVLLAVPGVFLQSQISSFKVEKAEYQLQRKSDELARKEGELKEVQSGLSQAKDDLAHARVSHQQLATLSSELRFSISDLNANAARLVGFGILKSETPVFFYFVDYTVPDAIGSQVRARNLIAEAWNSWIVNTSFLTVRMVDDKRRANVVVKFAPLDGPGNLVATFRAPDAGPGGFQNQMTLQEQWSPKRFQATAARQFGLLLGLKPTDEPGQLMSDPPVEAISSPQAEDIRRLQEVWGKSSTPPDIALVDDAALSNFPSKSILERIRTIVAHQLEKEPTHIAPDTSFADLGADELDITELLLEFQKEFGIKFPDPDFSRFRTIDDVQKHIEKQR